MHLGKTYSWEENKHGPKVVVTMSDLIKEIIDMTKKHIWSSGCPRKIPMPDGVILEAGSEEEKDGSKNCSIAGKAVFVRTKMLIEAANAVRELAKHFKQPKQEH